MNKWQSRINWLVGLASEEGIKRNELRLAIVLAGYPDDEVSPGLEELSADAGMHRSTVVRTLQALEERGALRRGKGGGRGRKTQWLLGRDA